MSKICRQLADWLSRCDQMPVIFAAYHRARSQNQPEPWLGLVYQDGDVCPWWEQGEQRHSFPAHHQALLSTHAGSRFAPIQGQGGLWICTFDLSRGGPRELFDTYHWQPQPIQQPALLIHAYQQVSRAFLRQGSTRELHLKAAVLHLLACVLDDVSGSAAVPHETLSTVYERLSMDFRNPELSLPDLAAEAGLSIHHFGRVFRDATGTTPMRYLRAIRLRQACALLATTELRINEIATEVGYRDPLHFSRLFRQATGQSPRQWRSNH